MQTQRPVARCSHAGFLHKMGGLGGFVKRYYRLVGDELLEFKRPAGSGGFGLHRLAVDVTSTRAGIFRGGRLWHATHAVIGGRCDVAEDGP